jgi:hypothetical protein
MLTQNIEAVQAQALLQRNILEQEFFNDIFMKDAQPDYKNLEIINMTSDPIHQFLLTLKSPKRITSLKVK